GRHVQRRAAASVRPGHRVRRRTARLPTCRRWHARHRGHSHRRGRPDVTALVEVVRSGFVESVHHGSLVVTTPDGAVRASIGDVHSPVYPRSSNKPLQALAMLRSGLEVADDDLALVCASHNGEPDHVERALALLERAGLTEDDLHCPPDRPRHEPAAEPRRAEMNCSGKHAGMLATCVAAGWPTADYTDPGHPLQRAIADTVSEMT